MSDETAVVEKQERPLSTLKRVSDHKYIQITIHNKNPD